MNKYIRILAETGIIFAGAWLLLYTALLIDESNKREQALEARYASSTLVNCEDTVIRGTRGETYRAFTITLRDDKAELWSAKIKLDHKLAKQCESLKEPSEK